MDRLRSQWRMQRNDMRLAHQLIEGHISNAFGGCRLPEGVDSEHFHSKGERQANNAPRPIRPVPVSWPPQLAS